MTQQLFQQLFVLELNDFTAQQTNNVVILYVFDLTMATTISVNRFMDEQPEDK